MFMQEVVTCSYNPEPCNRIFMFQAYTTLLDDLLNRGQVARGGTKHSGQTWVLCKWQIWSLTKLNLLLIPKGANYQPATDNMGNMSL